MKIILLFCFFILFLFANCKKEVTSSKSKMFYVGVSDANTTVDSFNVVVSPTLVSYHYYAAKDSFSLMGSGEKNIRIFYELLVPDLFPDEERDPFGYLKIGLKPNELNFECVVDSLGLLKQFNVGEEITSKLKWSNSEVFYFSNSHFPSSFANIWTDVEDKYFVFRRIQNDTIYGWGKISSTNNSIKIKQLGIHHIEI